MAEGRRVSTRLRTEKVLDKFDEPPRKRLQTRSKETPTKGKRASTSKSEPKPPKIVHKYGLPLTKEFDPSLLEALDTIAASGVLTASLQASKTRWITEGIFERYWVKPIGKKKAQQEQPSNNPPKESMVKVGPCVVTIQPHVFEATLYSIRDPNKSGSGKASKAAQSPQTPSQYQQQQPYPNPSAQHSTPVAEQHHQPQQQFSSSATPQPPPGNAPTPSRGVQFVNQSTFQTSTPQSQQPSQSQIQQAPTPPVQQASNPQPTQPSKPQAQFQQQQQPSAPPAHTRTQPSSQAASPAQPAPTTQSTSKTNHDPVIQMLAQRASTDPKLKALMKVVASGTANTDELKIFQSHIDELTAIIARQNALAARTNTTSPQVAPQPQKQQQPPQQTQPLHTSTQPRTATNTQFPQTVPGSLQQQNQQHTTYPPQPRNYQASQQQQYNSPFRQVSYPTPPQPSKPRFHVAARNDIIGACLEFHSHSGDRFTFPKHSVLEVLPGNRSLLASLLVVGKGAKSESGDYDPSKEYYQPVTLRIDATQEKIIDTLMRAVAPLGEVQRHMDDIMSRCSRAEHVQLSLTLPEEFPEPDDDNDEEQPKLPSPTVITSWKALKDAAAKGPILAEAKPVKGWKNKVEDWSQTCRFCYEQIERSQQIKIDENRPICQDCMRLLGMSGQALPNMSLRSKIPAKRRLGPESLMLDM